MNRARLTKEWLGKLAIELSNRHEMDRTPLVYDGDCMVYTLRSAELARTYCCYHVVGKDVDFILKKSDLNEVSVYQNLNRGDIRPRLSAPHMYEYVVLHNKATDAKAVFIALELIAVSEGVGMTDCDDQVDGLLMYQNGSSAEAWESAGRELARIQLAFWGIQPLQGIPYKGKDYDGLMREIRSSPRISMNRRLSDACEKVTERFTHMPRCLVNHDLFPINILIKERTFTAGTQRVIHPQAYIVDWTNGRPGPYILDLARVISHCHRETILDARDMLYSPKYCSDRCRSAIVESYAHALGSKIDRTELDKDLLCGEFFEIGRMFVQMPTVQPRDSYDRYYFFNMMSLADRVLTELT